MRFDLKDLQLLVHIAESGSITAGAQRANLSLGAASARVNGMESTLGVALFDRGRQGVMLSPAGSAALHHAQCVLEQMKMMRSDLSCFAEGQRGQIRLASNTAALTEYLPDLLGRFLKKHPTIDIEIIERPSQDIPLAIMEARAEIGIMANCGRIQGITTFPFREDHLVLIIPRSHSILGLDAVRANGFSFSEILDYDFVGLSDGIALQDHLNWNAERLGRRLKCRIKQRSFEAICQLISSGVGVSIIPKHAALRYQKIFDYEIRAIDEQWAIRELQLCTRSSQDLPTYTKLLIEALRA